MNYLVSLSHILIAMLLMQCQIQVLMRVILNLMIIKLICNIKNNNNNNCLKYTNKRLRYIKTRILMKCFLIILMNIKFNQIMNNHIKNNKIYIFHKFPKLQNKITQIIKKMSKPNKIVTFIIITINSYNKLKYKKTRILMNCFQILSRNLITKFIQKMNWLRDKIYRFHRIH